MIRSPDTACGVTRWWSSDGRWGGGGSGQVHIVKPQEGVRVTADGEVSREPGPANNRLQFIGPLEGIMMHSLQVLLGLIVLALTTAGQEHHAETLSMQLHRGTPLEERGREQLRRLLHAHDLRKWLFTRDVLIQSGVIPHSHPVLTLNTRYLDDDTAQLATFVHEQIHWFLTDHVGHARTNAAVSAWRGRYPQAPTAPPEGARDAWSTSLHLIVCTLELQALTELLGEPSARQQLARWTHYTWVYRTVLTDTEKLAELVRRHGMTVPERASRVEQSR